MWLRTVDAARRGGHLYAPGIAALGGDPDRLLLIEAGDTAALRAAANDAAPCPGSAAVVVDSSGRLPALDLTAGARSEERRAGKECVRTCRSRGAPGR